MPNSTRPKEQLDNFNFLACPLFPGVGPMSGPCLACRPVLMGCPFVVTTRPIAGCQKSIFIFCSRRASRGTASRLAAGRGTQRGHDGSSGLYLTWPPLSTAPPPLTNFLSQRAIPPLRDQETATSTSPRTSLHQHHAHGIPGGTQDGIRRETQETTPPKGAAKAPSLQTTRRLDHAGQAQQGRGHDRCQTM